MSIILYTGRPGAGKTYSMTHHLIKFLNKGIIVYSNYLIEWEGTLNRPWWKFWQGKYPKENLKAWSSIKEWETMTNCIIAVDDSSKVDDKWVKTGTKSLLYKYTFKNYEFGEEMSFSSKSDEYMTSEGKEFNLQLQVSQFGQKSPTVKLTGLLPVKK